MSLINLSVRFLKDNFLVIPRWVGSFPYLRVEWRDLVSIYIYVGCPLPPYFLMKLVLKGEFGDIRKEIWTLGINFEEDAKEFIKKRKEEENLEYLMGKKEVKKFAEFLSKKYTPKYS